MCKIIGSNNKYREYIIFTGSLKFPELSFNMQGKNVPSEDIGAHI